MESNKGLFRGSISKRWWASFFGKPVQQNVTMFFLFFEQIAPGKEIVGMFVIHLLRLYIDYVYVNVFIYTHCNFDMCVLSKHETPF